MALGLDPSLRAYGWSFHDDEAGSRQRRPSSGHEATLPSTVPVARFMHFQAMVASLLSRRDVDVVGIESPAYEAGPFQTIHFGLMMFSMVPVFEARKDIVLFDPSTLKLLARESSARKGPMAKLDMQRRVQLDTMDPKVIDNNEADAYLVGLYAARLIRLTRGDISPEQLTESEKRVFLTRERRVKRGGKTLRRRVSHAFRENSRYFKFSAVPPGKVDLPDKSAVRPELIEFLESLEEKT